MNILRQFVFIPKPTLTEENCPDQSGRVHLVTGGYSGCGFELCKILYQHNATLYIAGRSTEKLRSTLSRLQQLYPRSTGSVCALELDLADLTSVKSAVSEFISAQGKLHVLTLNAGIMMPPLGSKSAQGIDLQMATNCLGPYLLYRLLLPILRSTAVGLQPGAVRVTWAGSIVIDVASPRPGGIAFEDGSNEPKILDDINAQYGQSKAGNLVTAAAMARQDAKDGIMHLCWNPGNLATSLSRHMSPMKRAFLKPILYQPVYGAYTELWAAVADVPFEKSGSFVQPWGRLGQNRADVELSCLAQGDGGNGVGERFMEWCEQKVSPWM